MDYWYGSGGRWRILSPLSSSFLQRKRREAQQLGSTEVDDSVSSEHNGYVLISGSSSGIGQEMAVQMSGRYRLILNGRDAERLEGTRNSCANPSEHYIWRYDLSAVDQLEKQLTSFLSEHSIRVSSFVHCAALLKILPLRSQTLPMVRENMSVNFHSAMEIINVLMKKKVNDRRLQSVVFISSIASKFGAKGFSAYSASKGALDGLMKSLAVELAPKVRLNSILPGGIRTRMTTDIFSDQEMVTKFERDYPLGIGVPQDVINMVEFLISDKSRWITGQQFVVDGGRTTAISA